MWRLNSVSAKTQQRRASETREKRAARLEKMSRQKITCFPQKPPYWRELPDWNNVLTHHTVQMHTLATTHTLPVLHSKSDLSR